ncbi:nose resistant to fluoxetine protein 6 [Prorops nasuta]|uniref:nose resistant to fluoxetine protein 6 n=1 Tax=Prorops nasuta TaxID=863751 RepID=UPI0034CD26A8
MVRRGMLLCIIAIVLKISLSDAGGRSVEVLSSNGLNSLEEEEILRVLARNKSSSATSENFTFVELVANLRNHSVEGERNVWLLDKREAHSNPFYDEFNGKIDLEASKLLKLVPPFDPASGPVNLQCKRHSEVYMRELEKFSMWALRMHDATAKVSSGLLSGNVNQLGDFDECVAVDGSEGIQGQYCLVYLQLDADESRPDLKQLHRLLHSHYAFRSNVSDPGHRVPRFSTINWAVCTPSTCTHKDVEASLRHILSKHANNTGFKISVRVDEEMCQVKNKGAIPVETIVVGLFFLSVILLTLVAAYYDHNKLEASELLLSFSLKRNWQKLMSLERPEGDIAALHGVRALNAFMLIVAHKSMALFFNPYVNRTSMTEYLGKPWTVIGRAASLYTDPFIMLSGLLTAYSFIGRLNKTGKLDIRNEYLSRLLRLVPTLAALILFCTYIMPFIGSGPQWNLVVTHHAHICKKTWWRNFLFIHNYFGFENMCLTHTHHLGIDTQLFVFSPLMVMLLYKSPKFGSIILGTIAILSTILRYYVTYKMRLNNYVFFGTSIRQLFDTANLSYILPSHRVTVYIIGIFVGYFLRKNPKGFQLNKTATYTGWVVCSLMALAAFFGPAKMGSIDYIYDPMHAATYNAFAPIGWCALFAWLAVLHHTGNTNGWLSKLSSWKGFLITTRLSYAIYLTQFPVFFYNVGQTRSAEHYEFFRMNFNLHEMCWIIITSITLTLLFDSPFQNIKNYLLKKRASHKRTEKIIKKE